MFKRARIRSNEDAAQLRDDRAVRSAKRQAGDELRRFLLEKFCLQGMTGSDVAQISYFASRAGASGVSDLALQPSSATKNGHHHVMNHAGMIYPEVDLDYVKCPMFLKREAQRSLEEVPIFKPSKALKKYITAEMIPHPERDFHRIVGELDSYETHEVVCNARRKGLRTQVRPLAIYWDGVVYTKNDSFFAAYTTDILTGQKFLAFLLRSEEMCQCGCRGWCSLFPLLSAWASDLKSLAEGEDTIYAVLDVQGDWPALLQVFGLRYWSHNVHPCPLCRVTQVQFGELHIHDVTLDSLPFEPYTTNDYTNDMARSIKVVTIETPVIQKKIYQNLGYRKKYRGRVLLRAMLVALRCQTCKLAYNCSNWMRKLPI